MAQLTTTRAQQPEQPAPHDARAGRPDISFIVAAYNAAPFIEAAIRSALDQRGAAIQVIVVDDASTDETAGIVARLAIDEPRITLIERTGNAGPSSARNQAMDAARGEWLAILDGDDLISPDRSRLLLNLAALSGADVVADNYERFFSEDGSSGGTMIPQGPEPYAFAVDTAAFFRANRAYGGERFSLGAIKGMFRADFLRAHGITHREGLNFSEDFLFCLKCLLAGGRFIVTSECGYKYRKHLASQSWRMTDAHFDQLREMIEAEGLDRRFASQPEIAAAARDYIGSFDRFQRFTAIAGKAKQRRIGAALRSALTQPDLWPLLWRFGSQAVLKRIKPPRLARVKAAVQP